MGHIIESLLLLSAFFIWSPILAENVRPYDAPIIGVLSQEYDKSIGIGPNFPGHKSYIAASYVKAVEGSGAMVVPILIGQSQEYYE